MKKATLLLLVFFLAGCVTVPAVAPSNPMVQSLNSLPDNARNLILFLVTAALTWVLLQLSAALKVNLSGWVEPLAAVLSPILITVLESYLQMIPPVFDNLVLALINLLVLLAGSVGTLMLFRRGRHPKTLLSAG